ncbi:hypothetical protein DPMN_012284 [Dreissena polymorpha]|uniref:Uncharacterized protein n=1 Tax=Dreissena polymorpha TaxID=45954 RepID=A0A9D4N7Q1_DREPO|nr:hypothetical protein DPMN_012284 [Dreissena polymorpha]
MPVEPRSIPVCKRRSTGENRDDAYNFLTRSHYFPVPPRLEPVNNPAEARSAPD